MNCIGLIELHKKLKDCEDTEYESGLNKMIK